MIESLRPDLAVRMTYKGYAGGARNEGMRHFTEDRYTLWLDDDDVLIDGDALKKIRDCAEGNGFPDIIRFNFLKTRLSTGLRGDSLQRYLVMAKLAA